MIDRAIRDIDRERAGLQQQEKKLISEIKKVAKSGQMGAAKIMAKDLVRTRQYIDKFYKMRAQLQAVSLRMQTMKTNVAMTEAMKGVTKAMMSMNKQINLPAMQRVMMEFEKQSEMMDMKEELMSDAIDDVMDDADAEEQEEEILSKVLDEIGVNLQSELSTAPRTATAAADDTEAIDAQLQARLENLRGKS
eukprot:TRINITY_DN1320_c0_g1_i3.p1 TRINITY_DN1320_c0_g1~~TRINITY_DN1320_c0_g1_i3.p1  ORF type:complete len:215 (-),score=72.08 TRINITY_DN1320_c0_g1_i3:9-584(-)